MRRDQHPAPDAAATRTPARRAPLTRHLLLTAALHIVDQDGVEALTMRRLAHDVDREAMSLYRYAANKADLLNGVAELVLSELTIDANADDWCEELRRVARDFRLLALTHPHAVPLLVTRPLATPLGRRPPGMLRPLEDFLALLTHAGFSAPQALHAYRLFFGFLHGHILDELQEIVDNPEESEDLLRLGLHRLPRQHFPQLRALAHELADYDGANHLDHGVEMMLTGMKAHFRAPPTTLG